MDSPLHITAKRFLPYSTHPNFCFAENFFMLETLGERASWNIILRKGTIGNNDENEYK
jgi:hypothetical protein